MPPSAFEPPRATLRAEHRTHQRFTVSDSEEVGLTPKRNRVVAATSLRPTANIAASSQSNCTAEAGFAPSDDYRRGTQDCGIPRAAACLNHWQPNLLFNAGSGLCQRCDVALV